MRIDYWTDRGTTASAGTAAITPPGTDGY
jgi:hypothetical protein